MTNDQPAVGVIMPNVKPGFALGKLSLDALQWPLGAPAGLQGVIVSDLGPQDHIIGFPNSVLRTFPNFGVCAKVSVILAEPTVIHHSQMQKLRRRWRRFHRILSCNETLLTDIGNGILFPYGTCWVAKGAALDLTKSAMCSLIASEKRSQHGHRLRHEIAKWAQSENIDMDLLGRAYRPIEGKAEGLAKYRYSVVIENVRERGYFTEKLIDALICQTVPIYWGCPNIADFMDVSGIMICETLEDIQNAVRAMSDADYQARRPALRGAAKVAAEYADIADRAARAVLQDAPVPAILPKGQSAVAGSGPSRIP